MDPIGSVDLPLETSEHDVSNAGHREHDTSITKYFACRYCDKRYQYHEDWASTLQEHKNYDHPILKGERVTPDDWYIISEYVQDTEDEEEGAVVVDLERDVEDQKHTRYISCNWCDHVYTDLRSFAKHCKRAHEKHRFTNSDYSYLGRKRTEEVPIEEVMEVEVVTTEEPIESNTPQEEELILDIDEEERREMIERLEDDKHRKVDGPAFKRKVQTDVKKYKNYYDKNGNRRSHREAMIDHMHQNGDVARKGAAESRERAKDLKENPQTINEYHYGERKMSLIDDEISLVQNIPQTITRTHPTSPKINLDTTPLKGKSAKEVRKAIQQKKELEKVLMNRRFHGTTRPREPVVITVGAARVVKHTEEQNRRNGTQNNSTNGSSCESLCRGHSGISERKT